MPGARLARGCRDIYATSARKRHRVVCKFSELASLYGCGPIETPILEPATLFASLGETSDINISETYRLVDTDPELVLRPEGTAGVARALRDTVKKAYHGTRVWYAGPMFRRERPQAGRFRQFTQLGVEYVDGTSDKKRAHLHPLSDADAISLMYRFFTSLQIYPTVRLNTLGTATQRAKFNHSLIDYLTPRRDELSKQSQQRLDSGSCMRILDSKNIQDVETLRHGPSLREFQDTETIEAFENVCSLLRQDGVPLTVDEKLVRGLDYYTGTAFELDVGDTGRALGAGGRYSDVIEGVSGVGFAIGLERVEAVLNEMDMSHYDNNTNVALVIALQNETCCKSNVVIACRKAVEHLRNDGVAAIMRSEVGHVSKCIARAVRDGARAVVVIGSEEVDKGVAYVKSIVEEDKSGAINVEAPKLVKLEMVGKHVSEQFSKFKSKYCVEKRG